MKNAKKCTRCAKITSFAGLIAGIFLAAIKLTMGYLGKSRALIASGMCNLSDISSAIAVFLGVKYSNRRSNKKYQYGYGKLEFVVQVGISMLMILGNIALVFSSFVVIAKRAIVLPHLIVFFIAIISAIINGLIYKFANCGGKELNSPALRAHAEHNKIDVASSLLVAIGVLATRVGLHWADPVIAIFEAGHVIHGSWIIFWDGFKGLMDTGMPDGYMEDIREWVGEMENIKQVTIARARHSGNKVFLELGIKLNPNISVLESKHVVQTLKDHLRKKDRHLGNIFVQIFPSAR